MDDDDFLDNLMDDQDDLDGYDDNWERNLPDVDDDIEDWD